MIVKIFKTFKLTWWQAALYESAMISLGIVIGSAWPGLKSWDIFFWTLFLAFGGYVIYTWFRQVSKKSKQDRIEL